MLSSGVTRGFYTVVAQSNVFGSGYLDTKILCNNLTGFDRTIPDTFTLPLSQFFISRHGPMSGASPAMLSRGLSPVLTFNYSCRASHQVLHLGYQRSLPIILIGCFGPVLFYSVD